MKVFLTGGDGFIGAVVGAALQRAGHEVTWLTRRDQAQQPIGGERRIRGDVRTPEAFAALLEGHDAVVHLAGRAHILRERDTDPLALFRERNTTATLALARQAWTAGVPRFVFMSSIGVLGRTTAGSRAFTEQSVAAPVQPYAVSKLEAEQGLAQIAGKRGPAVTIIRPPLVYGIGAPGNMRRLLALVRTGLPLPLASAVSPRSFVGVDNLADFVRCCVENPAAAGKTFVVADEQTISTAELVRLMAEGFGRTAALFALPEPLTRLAMAVPPTKSMATQLFGQLTVDAAFARSTLGWRPPKATQDGIREMASAYLAAPW